jgi:hypothetical protein
MPYKNMNINILFIMQFPIHLTTHEKAKTDFRFAFFHFFLHTSFDTRKSGSGFSFSTHEKAKAASRFAFFHFFLHTSFDTRKSEQGFSSSTDEKAKDGSRFAFVHFFYIRVSTHEKAKAGSRFAFFHVFSTFFRRNSGHAFLHTSFDTRKRKRVTALQRVPVLTFSIFFYIRVSTHEKAKAHSRLAFLASFQLSSEGTQGTDFGIRASTHENAKTGRSLAFFAFFHISSGGTQGTKRTDFSIRASTHEKAKTRFRFAFFALFKFL